MVLAMVNVSVTPITGLLIPVGITVVATALRYQLNKVICGAKLGVTVSRSRPNAVVLEEAWLLFWSTALLLLSTWTVTYYNGRCSFTDIADCFAGWPTQPHTYQMRVSYAITLGWYIHGIVKSLIPGVGLDSGLDMMGHHLVSVSLIVSSHVFHLQRMGYLLLAILNISNPFMHFAKVVYHRGFGLSVTKPCFMMFAIAFCISRCVCFPVLVYGTSIAEMLRRIEGGEQVLGIGIVCLSLLTALQLLQVFWMVRIVRLLTGSKEKPARQRDTDETQKSSLDNSAAGPADVSASRSHVKAPFTDDSADMLESSDPEDDVSANLACKGRVGSETRDSAFGPEESCTDALFSSHNSS